MLWVSVNLSSQQRTVVCALAQIDVSHKRPCIPLATWRVMMIRHVYDGQRQYRASWAIPSTASRPAAISLARACSDGRLQLYGNLSKLE